VTDYYVVLQVHPSAEPEVIKAAYRVLAHKYHPDHGGDPARMAVLNDAWDVLGDPVRRAAYDAARTASTQARGGFGSVAQAAASPPAGSAQSGAQATSPAGARTAPWTSSSSGEPNHAGPPPGHPSGTVLDFGRYSGWSLGEIARYDVDYLEWLQRATFGRRLRTEIESILRQRRGHSSQAAPGWRGRR
jgi:curved DNA-binding protein CbpA